MVLLSVGQFGAKHQKKCAKIVLEFHELANFTCTQTFPSFSIFKLILSFTPDCINSCKMWMTNKWKKNAQQQHNCAEGSRVLFIYIPWVNSLPISIRAKSMCKLKSNMEWCKIMQDLMVFCQIETKLSYTFCENIGAEY